MASDDRRVLRSKEEVAAYLHRTRMEILDVLRGGPATSSQIAAQLGVHPANLTRHLRTLQGAGLIELVERRDTGRTVEKYYAVMAERFVVEPDVERLSEPQAIALGFAHSQLGAALARLPDDVTGPITALSLAVRLSSEAAQAYTQELIALSERFAAAEEPTGESFEIVLALYPGADKTPFGTDGSVNLTRTDGAGGPAARGVPGSEDASSTRADRPRPDDSRPTEGRP
jgi:DNA-binding transcriptional ArsR family regulator